MKNIFKKKLVILEPKGRLGNRLQTSAYSLAYAEEHQISLSLYCLDDYENWFAGNRKTTTKKWLDQIFKNFCIFLVKHRKLCKLLNVTVLHSCPKSPVIFTEAKFHQIISSNLITIVKGYYIYSEPRLLFKHKTIIEKFFEPIVIDKNKIKYHLDDIKKSFSIVVGVHIRRGDYKDYRGGKYFFSFEYYANLLHGLVTQEINQKIYFLICSDEQIPQDIFHDLYWETGPGDVLGDLYTLSLCDFVLGPSSTFNRWSSFYGNSPRLEIDQNTTTISFNDFTPTTDLTFSNISNPKIIN